MTHPLHIVVYGASLFLTVLTTSLQVAPDLVIDQVQERPMLPLVLARTVSVVIWEQREPPSNQIRLLQAGLLLIQADGQTSTFVFQHRLWEKPVSHSIGAITELVALMKNNFVAL